MCQLASVVTNKLLRLCTEQVGATSCNRSNERVSEFSFPWLLAQLRSVQRHYKKSGTHRHFGDSLAMEL